MTKPESRITPDEKWMHHAIMLARLAQAEGEVPVGAVIVENDQVIGEGWNQPISTSDPTAHAEIRALRQAAEHKQNYRIPGAIMYVTLEPCVMCAGAIFHARLGQLVFGTFDPKSGAAGSVINLFNNRSLNHHTQVSGGMLRQDCTGLLQEFFRARR